jgi:solute carrier family 25 (mitochondrial phosphate transporter), member 23/24/25/41
MVTSSANPTARFQNLRHVYEKHDRDGSGDVDIHELGDIFRELGIKRSDTEIAIIMKKLNMSQSPGKIDFEQFLTLFSESQLFNVFSDLDEDGSGTIKRGEIKAAMSKLGYRLSKKQCETMLSKIDLDGDNEISFEEFRVFFENVPFATLATIAEHWTNSALTTDCGSDMTPTIPPLGSKLKWWQTVLAGGCGGVLSRTFTAPLEKVKLNAQSGLGSGNAVAELISTYSKQGVRGLFAGNTTNCIRVFPTAGITCTCYINLLALTPADSEVDAMEPVYRLACGGIAALVGNVVTYPLDLLRAKLTVSLPEGLGAGSSGLQASCQEILAAKGWRRFYVGIKPTLLAVVPFVAIQNTSIDLLRGAAEDYDFSPSPLTLSFIGAIAGMLAQGIVYPLDALRRRLQVQSLYPMSM